MRVAITVRDVPTEVRDEWAARAARAGKSLQEYLRGFLIEGATQPTVDEVGARACARVDATGSEVDAELVTLDRRIALAPGVRCAVLTPPA